jgi:hypothetical protein
VRLLARHFPNQPAALRIFPEANGSFPAGVQLFPGV